MSPYAIPPLVTALLFFAFSAYVVWKRRAFVGSMPYLFWCLTTIYWQVSWTVLLSMHSITKAETTARLGYTGIVFIPIAFYHFTLRFLKFTGEERRLRFNYFIGALFAASVWMTHSFVRGVYRYSWGFYPKVGFLHPLYLGFLSYLTFHFMGLLAREKAGSDIDERRRSQVTYVYWALVAYMFAASDFIVNYGINLYPCGFLFTLISLALVSYAMVRHQLLGIQVVVKKTFLYSILSANLVAVYVATLTLITHFLQGRVVAASAYSAAIAAGAITLLADPLRNRIQRGIDRAFSRARFDREEKLALFSSQITTHQRVEETTRALRQILVESINPKTVFIYLKSERGAEFVEVFGEGESVLPKVLKAGALLANQSLPGVEEVVVITSHGQALGYLFLGQKRSELPYSQEDRILLTLLANQAALAYERPRLREEVSSSLVHELKMPLANITLPAELTFLQIQSALAGNTSVRELLPKIQQRMKYIIDQAMLASQTVDAVEERTSDENIHKSALHLENLCRQCLATFADHMRLQNVVISLDFAKDLPAVYGNANQMRIVLTNILKNAIEAMENNGSQPRELTITGRLHGDEIALAVEDSGPGIPPGEAELVFQSHYTTKGERGMGMGLFLSRQILALHDALIEVHPRSKRGTTMLLRFPPKVRESGKGVL